MSTTKEPKPVWGPWKIHVLYGSDLQLHPSVGGRLWYVVDRHDPDTGLTDALPLAEAKRAAERIKKQRSGEPRREPAGNTVNPSGAYGRSMGLT